MTTPDVPPVPSDPLGRLAYSLETVAMLDELWRCAFLPWRWPRYYRVRRVIRARNAAVRAALRGSP